MDNKQNTYIAITIGPILSTMDLVTSPAALWASSYLFSYISRSILKKLISGGYGLKTDDFIVPYAGAEKDPNRVEILSRDDGIGLLHDHIIFRKPDKFTIREDIAKIRTAVLEDTAANFDFNGKDKEFLEKYVLIAAVEYTAENPILGSSRMLDCMELSTPFPTTEENNPIIRLFTGGDASRNRQIKKVAADHLKIDFDKWQLLKDDDIADDKREIRSLGDVANNDRGEPKAVSTPWKRHHYYAIVRSDGDNMGTLISKLDNADEFHLFSQNCLNYCDQVAQKVREFGGMTVYVGGDDLLAILPCENAKGETVFDFIQAANEIFKQNFVPQSDGASKDEPENKSVGEIIKNKNTEISEHNRLHPDRQDPLIPMPSLTYGLTICHYKHPLFEALHDSADLLFGAKQKGSTYKNTVSVHLIKHSGQTSSFIITNDKLKDFTNKLLPGNAGAVAGDDAGKKDEAKRQDQLLLSAMHKLTLFETLFNITDSSALPDLFANIFDAEAHTDNVFVHETLPALMGELRGGHYAFALNEDGEKICLQKIRTDPNHDEMKPDETKPDCVKALCSLLRVAKFFREKAGERE